VSKGDFKLLSFKNHAADPYTYVVGIHAHKKKLDVVEIYFPSGIKENRYKDSIMKSIEAGVL